MKTRYITTALLSLGLVAGCVNVKVVESDGKPKHHEENEAGEQGEEKEDHDAKWKHHEGKEKEDREEGKEHEGKEKEGEEHEGKESGERGEKEQAKDSEAKLKAKAKITKEQAVETAMSKVPNGKIREGELEMENGKLQWSFDIATPGTRDITEVNINAITGEIIDISKETPADQAKEGDDEKKEKEKDKD